MERNGGSVSSSDEKKRWKTSFEMKMMDEVCSFLVCVFVNSKSRDKGINALL